VLVKGNTGLGHLVDGREHPQVPVRHHLIKSPRNVIEILAPPPACPRPNARRTGEPRHVPGGEGEGVDEPTQLGLRGEELAPGRSGPGAGQDDPGDRSIYPE